MAATFTGMGRKTDAAPNLPEPYVTIKLATIVTEEEGDRFDSKRDDAQAWFDSDEAHGEYDWTAKRHPLSSELNSQIEVFYHFTDPDTAFAFKLRFC